MNLMDSTMIALTRDSLNSLRSALMRDNSATAAAYLQEAGYAGGAALYDAFEAWLRSRNVQAPEELSVDAFQRHAAEFFRECGWGSLAVGELHETVATLDSADWGEAMPQGGMDYPCCHLTSGLFADFFGRMAGAPLAVMEVECRSTGAERCRFLLGSTEVLQHIYDGMTSGMAYDEAVGAAA